MSDRRLRKLRKFGGGKYPYRPRRTGVVGGSLIGALGMLKRKVNTNSLRLKTQLSSEKRRIATIVQAFDTAVPLSGANQSLQCISLTAQGDTSTNRDGNQTHIYKVRAYGHFQKVAENAEIAYCRVMIVRVPETCGAAITSALLLANDQSNDLIQQDLDLSRNYMICADKMYILGDSGHGTEKTLQPFDLVYTPPKGEITGYDGVVASIASTTKNHYFVLLQQSAAATSDVKGYCNAVIHFNP